MIAGGIGRTNSSPSRSRSSSGMPDETKRRTMRARVGGVCGADDGSGEEKKLDFAEQMLAEAENDKTNNDVPAQEDDDDERRAAMPFPAPKAKGKGQQRSVVESSGLPDMTGKIISVSAEETLKLTKERKKKGGIRHRSRRGGGDASLSPSRAAAVARKNNDPYEPTNSEMELMADVEQEFQDFISKLGAPKHQTERSAQGGVNEKGDDCATSLFRTDPPPPDLGGGGDDNDSETNDAILRRRSEFVSDYTIDAMMENIDDMTSQRRSQPTMDDMDDDDNDESITPIRPRLQTRKSEYTIDTWTSRTDDENAGGGASARRRQSDDPSLFPDNTSMTNTNTGVSESLCAQENRSINNEDGYDTTSCDVRRKNSDANDTFSYQPRSRVSSSHRRAAQPFHRSSLRRSGVRGENSERTLLTGSSNGEDSKGISWGTLITMDADRKKVEERAKKKSSSNSRHRRAGEKKGQLNLSNVTADSRASGRSKNSHKSRNSSGKDGSQRSGNNKTNHNVSWKNESCLTNAASGASSLSSNNNNRDPEYVRKQSAERFERGLHYARRGNHAAARDRFLTALRYRVMRHGKDHPDIAAAHEMLGHVYYCLGMEATREEEEEAEEDGLFFEDGGDGGIDYNESMLGWDPVATPKTNNHKKIDGDDEGGRGKVYFKKAAMHYRTVSDILLGSDRLSSDGIEERRGQSSLAGTFKWFEIAESYEGLEAIDSGDGDDGEGNEERMKQIIARVREKLASLPMAAASKSYAGATFLGS